MGAPKVVRLARPFAGTFTVQDAALFLRATTPRPEAPVRLWTPRSDSFVASTQAIYFWIRRGLEWDDPVRISSRHRVITFEDLIRLRMIALLRARGISYDRIRRAEEYARMLTGLPQPFVTEGLWTALSDVFMEFESHLLALSKDGQLALPTLREFLAPAAHGLSFDRSGIAETWRPSSGVVIDPEIQFGAPTIEGTRVETEAIWSLHEAGETASALAEMYRLSPEQVSAAIDWERTVALAA